MLTLYIYMYDQALLRSTKDDIIYIMNRYSAEHQSTDLSSAQVHMLATASELAQSGLASYEVSYGRRDLARYEVVAYYAGRLVGRQQKAGGIEAPGAITRRPTLKRVYLQTDYTRVNFCDTPEGLSQRLEVTRRTNFDTGDKLTLIEAVVTDEHSSAAEVQRQNLLEPLDPEKISALQNQFDECLGHIASAPEL